jgi:hypothetical protein
MANSAGPRCRRPHFPFSEIDRAAGSAVGSIIAVAIKIHNPTERRKVGADSGPGMTDWCPAMPVFDVPWWWPGMAWSGTAGEKWWAPA